MKITLIKQIDEMNNRITKINDGVDAIYIKTKHRELKICVNEKGELEISKDDNFPFSVGVKPYQVTIL